MSEAPGVRSCAGVPLKSPDGHRVGTLCVINIRLRALNGARPAQAPRQASLLSIARSRAQ
ncbi:GAF domain-containing protein [Azohydromonas aeria]|uniref:GAF domain-containing protein n=1 Tax=Azohydromonas aeria TaxID=2590212 RepID=UPI0035BF6F23